MQTDNQATNIWSFHAEGLSCIKCIRKVQAVAQDFASIEHIKVDLGSKKITAHTSTSFDSKSFISALKDQGFQLKVIAKDDDKNLNPESNKALLRIGVAGFCAGNIMLFSAADYVGANSESWFQIFPVLSAILFLPVFLYSAWSFYQNTYMAISARRMSIDIPIVLAILVGALISYYNILQNSSEVYFDSISMFIFLLLSSRFLIYKIQNRYLSPIKVEDVCSDKWVQKITDKVSGLVQVESLQAGDIIEVTKNQFIPVDGELLSSEALISDSFYSGEFLPKAKIKQDYILAGSKCLSEKINIKVVKVAAETRLAEIIHKLNYSLGQKTKITTLADRGASYFVMVIVLMALVVLGYYASFNLDEGLNRIMALLIVACPCGLAIVIPLIQTLALKKGLKDFVLIKDPNVLENLSQIKTVFFDKTGTLTSGEIKVSVNENDQLSELEKNIIYNLEKQSEHPIAKALVKWVGFKSDIKLDQYKETLGTGVSAYNGADFYELKSTYDQFKASVGFYKNKVLISTFILEDTLALGVEDLMVFLKSKNIESYILSGDLQMHAQKVAEALKINPNHVFAQLSPEDKYNFVQKFNSPALYIGDGVNDSMAMSECLVSVSMESSANVAFKSSGVHILSEGLSGLKSLFLLSDHYLRAIKITILISFIYNLSFAALALFGLISPLVAIFLMPLSSMSLTFIAMFLMRDTSGHSLPAFSKSLGAPQLQGAKV